MMGNLSENFSIEEFTASQTAARSGRIIVPTDSELDNLVNLVTYTMQPIRDMLGVPISINSGLRPEWLNTLIGGSKTSQHMKGEACDFVANGITAYEVALRISDNIDIRYDQLIHEFGSWVHISFAFGMTPRRNNLTARYVNGETEYIYDIVA